MSEIKDVTDSKNNNEKKKKKPKVKVFDNKKRHKEPEAVFIKKLVAKYESIDIESVSKFSDIPLSPKTIKGLRESGYHKPTEIQRQTIGLALQGKDILGAAQTGSGKTLAFLIPILERLFVKQWTKYDGVGALVITPTRELAYQIFEALRKIGQHHEFSAGLIIGGKDLKFERSRMDQCNIVICTPGRVLQHMDENPLFNCDNLEILVLDEADRCLDMGFKDTMNAIVANLPVKRQTMLFSATQTKSVKDLARLSLKNPSYVSVQEFMTPKDLKQSYVVCELQDKMSILWSFIKNHLKQKIIIFFSSCKQVKYTYEIFCKLRPGVTLLSLYGTMHQLRRMTIYNSFCQKERAVLFATDIAARGLDFPNVHWVVQADCPEDVATYVHRVGRTARYHKNGESLLLLLDSELKMIDYIQEKNLPIEKIDINPIKLSNPVRKMEAFLAKDPALKDTAQRAFISYAKAVFLMKDKSVFDVNALDLGSYAKSLGLAIPPRIRFLKRMEKKMNISAAQKNNSIDISSTDNNKGNKKIYFDDDSDADNNKNSSLSKNTKKDIDSGVSETEDNNSEDDFDSSLKQKPSNNFDTNNSSDSDSDDDILKVKRKDHDIDLPTEQEIAQLEMGRHKNKKALTKAAVAKKILKKKIVPNKKIVFDEEGEAVPDIHTKKSELAVQYENEDLGGIDIEKAKQVLREEDKFDKQLFKEKVKAKHKEEKRKLKEKKRQEQEGEVDEFGESDSDEGPDLSWLPDPDKIYGDDSNKDDDADKSDPGDQTVGDIPHQTVPQHKKGGKRKNIQKDDSEMPVKKKGKHKLQEISSSLNVNEAEELALMLLRNKKI